MTPAETRFNELFDANHHDILAYLSRRVDQPADAADLLVDVFMAAWRRRQDISDLPQARLWLFGVARKSLLNYRRGQGRRHELADRLRQELAVATQPDPGLHDRIRTALDKLPAMDRELITLAFWEGLSPAEISVAVGWRAGTVRVRLHRARQRLRRLLERESSEVLSPAAIKAQSV